MIDIDPETQEAYLELMEITLFPITALKVVFEKPLDPPKILEEEIGS